MILTRGLRGALLVAVVAFFMMPTWSWGVVVNGITYELTEGDWYVYDDFGAVWQIAPDIVEIKFEVGTTQAQIDTFSTNHDLTDTEFLLADGWHQFQYDIEEDPLDVLAAIFASPIVADAWLDTFGKNFGTPNDEYFDQQWDTKKMDLERAWDVDFGTTPVTIAIIDDGIFNAHQDLGEQMWLNPEEDLENELDDDNDAEWNGQPLVNDYWGWNFDGNNNAPTPKGPHGTAVAGVAAATTGNADGVAGVAGVGGIRLVSLVASRAAAYARALRYCRFKNLDVVSMSIGFEERPALSAELDSLKYYGSLIFASSGNGTACTDVAYPARHPSVVAVGAVDDDDIRWSWSCYGESGDVDIVASAGDWLMVGPGTTTTDNYGPYDASGYNDNGGGCFFDCLYYDKFGGTSAACPATAGVAALLWAYNPALSSDEVRDKMFRAAKDLGDPGSDEEYGHGRVDAYRAVTQWGLIESDTTWGQPGSALTVYISGDLTVASGTTLTILPGTTVKVADTDNETDGADENKVEINVEGELIANGTALAPITFESWAASSNEDWVGFYFDSGSDGALFDNCVIRHAEYGIETFVNMTITNSDFEDCKYAGIVGKDGTTLVHGCNLSELATWGIVLTAADATIRNTVVDGAAVSAVHVQPNATLALRGSVLRNSDKGLYAGTSFVTIDSSCVVTTNNIGIHCYGTSPSILRSAVTYNTVDGILCDNAGNPTIQYCQVSNNDIGVYCSGTTATPVMRRNTRV